MAQQSSSSQQRTIAYKLVTEHNNNNNNQVLRYCAVWVETITAPATVIATTTTPTNPTVSVYEWTRYMLLEQQDKTNHKHNHNHNQKATSCAPPSASSSLLDQFIQLLQNGNSFSAYFFETKGVTATNAHTKPFEFVLVHAPQLQSFVVEQSQQRHEQQPFANHLDAYQKQPNRKHMSCVFANLGGDATLVAPLRTTGVTTAYTHLANFVRQAPYDQVQDFWVVVLQTYLDRLTITTTAATAGLSTATTTTIATPDNEPVWLSTSGMGVAWLHMRLDRCPKYYSYKKFAKEK